MLISTALLAHFRRSRRRSSQLLRLCVHYKIQPTDMATIRLAGSRSFFEL